MTPSAEEIRAWIVDRVSHLTAVPPAEVDVGAPFTSYGLDSVAMIALAADLEKWLGHRFRDNPLADHPTIEVLARALAEQIQKKTTG
jgi:acyl carrier protein